MIDCKHAQIVTWCGTDGEPVRLWSCTECNTKFVPIANELRLERERDRALSQLDDALNRLQMAHERIAQLIEKKGAAG
jgi:hypothetical protein